MSGQAVEIVVAALLAAAGGTSGASAPAAKSADGEKDKQSRPTAPLNLLAPIAAPTPSPKADVYDLRTAGDGTGDLLYDASGFSARVARDGSVTFTEPSVRMLKLFEPFLPRPGPRNVPSLFTTINSLARNRGMPAVDENAQTEDRYLLMPNTTRYRPDPREGCRACVRPVDPVPVNVAGRFDLTEELMRFNGQDPYGYDKAKFLAGTRELRAVRAAKSHAENLHHALAALPGVLQQIACDAGRSVPERRAIIEKLREELDGSSAESQSAAATITRFLAQRFGADAGAPSCP